ncbi:hypothetical protein HDU98_000593 [Podochytrium sp. JEL0797]|nr:hypothetical protein HDU98_000593 [Podochytrium sp. JEL0797]
MEPPSAPPLDLQYPELCYPSIRDSNGTLNGANHAPAAPHDREYPPLKDRSDPRTTHPILACSADDMDAVGPIFSQGESGRAASAEALNSPRDPNFYDHRASMDYGPPSFSYTEVSYNPNNFVESNARDVPPVRDLPHAATREFSIYPPTCSNCCSQAPSRIPTPEPYIEQFHQQPQFQQPSFAPQPQEYALQQNPYMQSGSGYFPQSPLSPVYPTPTATLPVSTPSVLPIQNPFTVVPSKCELKIEAEFIKHKHDDGNKPSKPAGLNLSPNEWHNVTVTINPSSHALEATVFKVFAKDTQSWSLKRASVETRGFNIGVGRPHAVRIGLLSGRNVVLSFGSSDVLQMFKIGLKEEVTRAGQ